MQLQSSLLNVYQKEKETKVYMLLHLQTQHFNKVGFHQQFLLFLKHPLISFINLTNYILLATELLGERHDYDTLSSPSMCPHKLLKLRESQA